MRERDFFPQWVLGNGRIDESVFCQEYLYYNKLIYHEGAFFDVDGKITDMMKLRTSVYEMVGPFVTSNVHRRVDSLLETMKIVAYRPSLDCDPEVIHVANGAFDLNGPFREEKTFCRYRLPVKYNIDAPEPKRWLQFLEELLYEEDILTLQEYMGYCLLPVTHGQKMLLIIGNGGEGKSRIGVVMREMLGNYMKHGSLSKVASSPFAQADLEHILLMVDDDLKLEALNQTNHLKTIITAETPLDLERKGIQSYQGRITARLMAFGNSSLQALHDRSRGFFRRQIILTTRDRRPDRVDDPFLGNQLKKEIEGIFLWSLVGLYRLRANDYRFTISQRAQENLRQSITEGNNVVEFMESEGYFRFDPNASVTSRQLYNVYKDWCGDNIHTPLSARSFWAYLNQNAEFYGLSYSNNISIGNGKRARGFRGMRIASRY